MKASFLMSIARQVQGEFVFCKVVKANTSSDKLHKFLRENELPAVDKIGDVDVVIEYGVFEDIEIEE